MERTWTAGPAEILLARKCCFIIVIVGVIGTFEQPAAAYCNVESGVRECGSPNGTTLNGAIGIIGRDSNGDQWVGWQDATTFDCLEWDQIGGTSSFYNSTTRIYGTNGSDWLATSLEDYSFCGKVLDPPVNPSGILALNSWDGGSDTLIASVGFHVEMECQQADSCSMYAEGPANFYGSPYYDQVTKAGSGFWNFFTYGGDDTILDYSSVAPTNGQCGDGDDYYDGPNGNVSGCECTPWYCP